VPPFIGKFRAANSRCFAGEKVSNLQQVREFREHDFERARCAAGVGQAGAGTFRRALICPPRNPAQEVKKSCRTIERPATLPRHI
jgi:hypothetical protein